MLVHNRHSIIIHGVCVYMLFKALISRQNETLHTLKISATTRNCVNEMSYPTVEWHTPDHIDHAPPWSVDEPNGRNICLACLVQLLETEGLSVKRKMVVGELMRLMGSYPEPATCILTHDLRVTVHVAGLLLGYLGEPDETFVLLVIEALYQLILLVKDEELICCILESSTQKCLKTLNYKQMVPVFSLLGRLLREIPALPTHLITSYGSLVDVICSGLCYPDNTVQSCLSYICLYLYKSDSSKYIPIQLSGDVAKHVVNILLNNTDKQTLLNVLGLLKTMLGEPALCDLYLGAGNDKTEFPACVKKLILTRDEGIQIATVQCMVQILDTRVEKGERYVQQLLQADIAEFLFEALHTTNELLIRAIFNCLHLLTQVDAFFVKCHAVFGVEAVLRSIEEVRKQKNSQLLTQGVALLAVLLERHRGGIRLFSSSSLVNTCLSLVDGCIKLSNHTLFIYASSALLHTLKRENLPSPVPFSEILQTLHSLVTKTTSYPAMTCTPARAGVRGAEGEIQAAKTQQSIIAALTVFEAVFKLCSECSDDPLAVEGTFAAPRPDNLSLQEPTPVTVQECVAQLVRMVEDSGLPAVMVNCSHVTHSDAYVKLYSILNHIYSQYDAYKEAFSVKLSSLGLISLVLNTKDKFKNQTLTLEGDSLLYNILESLLKHHGHGECIGTLRPLLKQGIAHLQGTVDKVSSSLTDQGNNTTPGDQTAIQCTCIVLLYMAHRHKDRSLTGDSLLPQLERYIRTVHETPPPLLAFIIHLYAILSKEQKSGVLQSVMELVEKCHKTSEWCIRKKKVLHWCFKDDRVALLCGQHVINYWLEKDDVTVIDIMVSLASSNLACVKALMSMSMKPGYQNSVKVVEIITLLFKREKCSCRGYMSSVLPELIYQHVLTEGGKVEDFQRRLYLRVLTTLKMWDIDNTDNIQAVDLKLVNAMSKLLEHNTDETVKNDVDDDDMVDLVLAYINAMLYHALKVADERVVCMCIEKPVLLQSVTKTCNLQDSPLCVLYLTQLAFQVYQFNIQIKRPLRIPYTTILSQVGGRTSVTSQLCALLFWTAIYHTRDHLLFDLYDDDRVQLLNDPHDKVVIGVDDVRGLYLMLLQIIVQENILLQDITALCLETLIQGVSPHEKLCSHLVSLPWNMLMLQQTIQLYAVEDIPYWLLRVLYVMTGHDSFPLTETSCKQIADLITSQKKITPLTLGITQNIIKRVESGGESNLKDTLTELLQTHTDTYNGNVERPRQFVQILNAALNLTVGVSNKTTDVEF